MERKIFQFCWPIVRFFLQVRLPGQKIALVPAPIRLSSKVTVSLCAVALMLGFTACREVVVQPAPSGGRGAKTGYADVISNAAPCVVSVHTRTDLTGPAASALDKDPALRKLLEEQEGAATRRPRAIVGLGSGVVVTKNGYILTSAHVIDGADKITVSTSAGEEFKAKVIGKDKATDIAVLKVDAKNLPVAKLADSSRLRVGDIVLAIGNPFGVGQTVTSGIISGTDRDGFGIADFEDFIQTDAPINPGNSGGALIDAQGRVVGISIAILSSGGGFEGIGLAVPVNLARNVMSQLMTHGKVVRGYLGATLHPVRPRLAKASHTPPPKGAQVVAVTPDSPATRAGLRQGDVILEFNGQPVADHHQLRMRLAEMKPGTPVTLKLRRDGATRKVRVTLGETPPMPAATSQPVPVATLGS